MRRDRSGDTISAVNWKRVWGVCSTSTCVMSPLSLQDGVAGQRLSLPLSPHHHHTHTNTPLQLGVGGCSTCISFELSEPAYTAVNRSIVPTYTGVLAQLLAPILPLSRQSAAPNHTADTRCQPGVCALTSKNNTHSRSTYILRSTSLHPHLR